MLSNIHSIFEDDDIRTTNLHVFVDNGMHTLQGTPDFRHIWRWCSFSPGGICEFPGGYPSLLILTCRRTYNKGYKGRTYGIIAFFPGVSLGASLVFFAGNRNPNQFTLNVGVISPKKSKPCWGVVSKIFYFHPYLGKWSNLTNIFQMGWNNQLACICVA